MHHKHASNQSSRAKREKIKTQKKIEDAKAGKACMKLTTPHYFLTQHTGTHDLDT